MYHTKKDVDKHLAGILEKIKDENERKIRSYAFAKMYFGVKDYESARRYLADYLSVNDKHAGAFKLMGQIHDATGNPKQALQSFKHSLALEENQKDVILKICEIYSETPADRETIKYWLERAEQLFPGHRVVFKLKEGMARAAGGDAATDDIENLITTELVTRPLDVKLREKLLRLLLNSGRVLDSYKHALQAEEEPQFAAEALHSVDWQRCLADVFEAYHDNLVGPVDEPFLTKFLLTLDQLAGLLFTYPGSLTLSSAAQGGSFNGEPAKQGERAAVEDALNAINLLDRLLKEAHDKKWTRGGAWDFVLEHVTAQLYLHVATVLLKKAWKERCSWPEARGWVSGLLLAAYAVRPPRDLFQEPWFRGLDMAHKALYRSILLRAHHRLSVCGHLLHLLCDVEDKSRWLSDIKQEACTPEARRRIYRNIFDGEEALSWFLHDPALVNRALEFPTRAALLEHDQESQWLHPASLNHLAWLALHWARVQDKSKEAEQHCFEVHVFENLQRRTHSFNTGASETLSQMDAVAFLEATCFCAAHTLAQKGVRPSQGPLGSPPHVGIPLCTGPQAEWWSAAYRLHTSTARDKMADLRRTVQRGLEVIRGIGNHGMDLALVAHLARTFAHKSSSKRAEGLEEEAGAFDDQAARYWEVLLSMLERASGTVGSPSAAYSRLFGAVSSGVASPQEVQSLKQEAKTFLAVRAMNADCLNEAIDMLSELTTAQSAFYTALVLKKMSEREFGVQGGGTYQALLRREHEALELALERGRRELDQGLVSAVRSEMEDLQERLSLANVSNGSLGGEAAEEPASWMPDASPFRSAHTGLVQGAARHSSTPRTHPAVHRLRDEGAHSSQSEATSVESPARPEQQQPPSSVRLSPAAAAAATASAAGTGGGGSGSSSVVAELVELQLRSLSLHQELVMSQLRQMQDSTQAALRELKESQRLMAADLRHQQATMEQLAAAQRELKDSQQAMSADLRQRQVTMEQLAKKVEEVAARSASASASRPQRQREEPEYVDDYSTGYEGDYDQYGDYSPLEATGATGGSAPPLMGAPPPPQVAPPPASLAYPPFRCTAYASYAPHLSYPLPPPPHLARHMPPPAPLPPQPFYSSQVAAAAAAVPTPGLCLTEGQALPQFTFDISQPPPAVPGVSGTSSPMASGDAGRLSAFSRLGGPKPPALAPAGAAVATSVGSATPATPPKPANAPHAFQIALPPSTGASAPPGSSLGGASPAVASPFTAAPPASAAAAAAPRAMTSAPQLHGLLTGTTPALASVAPEKQGTPTTASMGTRTAEASPAAVHTPSPLAPRRLQRVSTGSDDYVEEVEVEGNFTPLISLPEEVAVCTGEENEKVLFEERAKLFRYVDKEWKERGIGVVKLLENEEGKVRLLMRREQVLKVCANHRIHAGMALTPMPKKDTAWIWDAQDFSDGEPHPEKFCIRFKTAETAAQFKDAFDQAVRKSQQAATPTAPAPSSATVTPTSTGPSVSASTFSVPKPTVAPSAFGTALATSVAPAVSFGSPLAASFVATSSPPTSLPHLPATGFGKMFHPKPGSWQCQTCYVSNDGNKLTCAACDTPKPGTEKPKMPSAETATSAGVVPQPVARQGVPTSGSFGGTATSAAAVQQPAAKPTVLSSSLFGGAATAPTPVTAFPQPGVPATSSPSVTQVAPAASVFKFGVTMPEQRQPTPFSSGFAASTPMPGKNVFGGFTFSSPPKVVEVPRETPEPVVPAAAVKEPAKPSPFAGFSFKSPAAPQKKDEATEAATATQSFLAGARSEISKVNFAAPKFQMQATSPSVKPAPVATEAQVAPPASKTSLPTPPASRAAAARSPMVQPSPPAGGRQRGDSLRSPGEIPEDFVPSAEFEPVVALPELVEVKTGEEDEEVLFCERAKLYRFDSDSETKQWKERGIGQLKILRHRETQVCRVLMRRDQVLKLCANHRIVPEMKLARLASSDRTWSWFANDYSEGKQSQEGLAVRFKTQEQAALFKEVFERCRDAAQPVAKSPSEEEEEKGEDAGQQPEAAQQPPQEQAGGAASSVPLSQLNQFRPKPGSWNCDVCYVSNPADKMSCVACETRRPGAPAAEASLPPLKALEKFAAPVSGGGGFPIGSAPSTAAPAKFSFGFSSLQAGLGSPAAPAEASSAPGKATGFVFGSLHTSATAAPPSTFTFGVKTEATATTGPTTPTSSMGAFKFGSPQKYEFSFSGVRPRSPGKTPKSPCTPSDVEEEETVESPEADIYFQPVVPLPPKVEVRTGEEDEEVLYSHRAKLYRWMDGEWKERGLGDIKLLRDSSAGRTRLLMRREPVLKVCLNHLLTPELQFGKKDDRTVLWSATDFSDGEPAPYQFALRLKSAQVAEEFLAAVESARGSAQAPPPASQASSKPAVDASTFSFRLDGATVTIPSTMATGFSLGSRFGASRPTVVRSLFGNVSPAKDTSDSDVQIVYEAKASPEQIARARALKLPDHFYLYETKPPCSGCRGCDDWESKKKALLAAGSSSPSGVQPASAPEAPHLAAADSTTGGKEEESTEAGTPLFGSGGEMTFADLARQQSGAGFGLQGPSPKSGQSLFSGAGSKLFQSTVSRRKSEGEDDGADEVVSSEDIHFEPVVPLPDLVEVRTGEEDEEQLFCHRAKLYLFDIHTKQWKERALGEIKILKHKARPFCFRVLMRRDQVHKVACNHSITEFTKPVPLSTSANTLTWKALDFAEGKSTPETFAVRFKNAEIVRKFEETFEQCRLAVVEHESRLAASKRNGELQGQRDDGSRVAVKDEEEEDVDEDDDDEDDDDDDDDDEPGVDIMFEKRVTLAAQRTPGGAYETLGMGSLQMVYDDSCYGARIRVMSDDGCLLCDTLVAVQTCLRTERLHAFWSAVDMSREPHVRRHFQATFSSPQAIAEFSRTFTEAKDFAVQSEIVETIDEPPSRP